MIWQPIETVPRDGTIVILLFNDGVKVAAWDPDPYYAGSPWCCFCKDPDSAFLEARSEDSFTHWMPLPSQPEIA
jgi:hypothetical protein